MKKTFKILSIDGGGIKGIYSAALLAKFEKLSNQTLNKLNEALQIKGIKNTTKINPYKK